MADVIKLERKPVNAIIVNSFCQAVIENEKPEIVFVIVIKSEEGIQPLKIPFNKLLHLLHLFDINNTAELANKPIRITGLEIGHFIEDKWFEYKEKSVQR